MQHPQILKSHDTFATYFLTVIISLIIGTLHCFVIIGASLGYIIDFYRTTDRSYPRIWPISKRRGITSIIFACLLSLLFYSLAGSFTYAHIVLTIMTIFGFLVWQRSARKTVREFARHGTAHFSSQTELSAFRKQEMNAIYLGGKYHYTKQGHLLTVAGTRAGKGVNLIVPNLLGAGSFKGSWVILDPKAELSAITAKYQQEQGKQVRILNPWGLLDLPTSTYNPLDLINDPDSDHLADDAQVIAHMIVPSEAGKDDHWNNRARTLITAMLMHQSTLGEEELTLSVLWQNLRLSSDEWLELLAAMALNEHPVSGPIIAGTANEILTIMENSEKEATGIISTAQRWTDVFKSIPLRRSLEQSSFSINELSEGNTVLYVIIPADKLKSHSTWLRLVTTTALKAVVRNPNQRVLFCLDEFYALGYLPEIEVALGTYAGYGITIWTIVQSLVQLQNLYGKNWENFIGNSAVIQAFGLNDNTTTRYISELAGKVSVPTFAKKNMSTPTGSSARPLITADEARRLSDAMLLFIENHGATVVPKLPYYEHKEWNKRAQPNPYYQRLLA